MSQPTVTRRRSFLEKELIDGYTAIPKWEKLGYEMLVITFVKIKANIASTEKYEATRKRRNAVADGSAQCCYGWRVPRNGIGFLYDFASQNLLGL